MERIPSMRNRVQERSRISALMYVILFLLFVGVLLLAFLHSPLSKIKAIKVVGIETLTKNEVLVRAGIYEGGSILSFKSDDVASRIAKLPQVSSVEVSRAFPGGVNINIHEKNVVVAIGEHNVGQRALVLADGTVLQDKALLEHIIVPTLQGVRPQDHDFLTIVKGLAQVPKNVTKEFMVVGIAPKNKNQLQIETRRRHTLFVRIDEAKDKLRLYSRFLKHAEGELHLLDSIWFSPKVSESKPVVRKN